MPSPAEGKPRARTNITRIQRPIEASETSPSSVTDLDPERPRSPKATRGKHETRFQFDSLPSTVAAGKRRSSEPRAKKKERHRDEVAQLRRQFEGAEVFAAPARRRSSVHQHSVPPAARRQSVHVTANPLEAAAGGAAPAGRTTIVVQQPSLSLEYGGCTTLLVRDAGTGPSSGARTGDAPRRSRAADHLQQLLDVTGHLTAEDLHDFDKR